MLVEFGAKLHDGAAPKKFGYRGLQPLFEGSEFSVNANDTGAGMELWTANSAGQPTMKGHRDVVRGRPSFRGDAKHRARKLEIPGLVLTHHPGMTE